MTLLIHLRRFTRTMLIACAGMLAATASLASAQAVPAARFLDVGSEQERTLRLLQLIGEVPLTPWSIRQLSPSELDRLPRLSASHAGLLEPDGGRFSVGPLRLDLLPVTVQGIYNSAFPYGYNDGPVWAGRGLTGVLSLGIAGRIGPLSFQLEPEAFDAQNRSFALKPTGVPGNPYADAFFVGQIDLPQRFGDRAYRRFDPGQSSVRLDVGPLAAEVSTADQWWGPAIESPLILGDNAPGFLHGMVGTSHPIDIGIGRLHGRLVAGRLGQSAYAIADPADSVRFMSGVIAEFLPRGLPGLEVGASRFFHTRYPTNGLAHAPFFRSLEGVFKAGLGTVANPEGNDPDNQLASAFFRWAFPGSALEIYGEYGREDHNTDLRDLEQEPDHDAGYTLGLQRVWRSGATGLTVLRAEILNTRISTLNQGRPQAPWYIHTIAVAQGHTVDGQLLGAPGGYGGGATTIGVDRYTSGGRWTVEWDRQMRAEEGAPTGTIAPLGADVFHSLRLEREQRLGATAMTAGVRGVWELNRDFVRDQFNLNATIGVRRSW